MRGVICGGWLLAVGCWLLAIGCWLLFFFVKESNTISFKTNPAKSQQLKANDKQLTTLKNNPFQNKTKAVGT